MAKKRERLKRVRASAGLTQEEVAYRLGVDKSTVWRWEAGASQPEAWQQPRLAKLLRISRGQLIDLIAESLSQPRHSPAAHTLQRRAGRGRVGSEVVEELSDRVLALADCYEAQPSTSLLAAASQCHALITGLLQQVGNDRQGRELHRVATESAMLLSQLVWDGSARRDSTGAVAYCDEAIGHANEIGDQVAAAKAELRKAYVCLYGGADTRNPAIGLTLAQRAAEQGKDSSPAFSGVALLHVGEAFAMLGEYRQCERALSDADYAFTQIPDDDPAADWFSPTQFGRLAGSCYLSLANPERAEILLTEAAAQLGDRPKSCSLVLGNLALARLRQRQLDGATETLHEAIDLLEQSRGGGGMTVVFSAVRELYQWRSEPAVQDVQDRALALMS